eukprot:2172540-Prymnesium_polylepis.1
MRQADFAARVGELHAVTSMNSVTRQLAALRSKEQCAVGARLEQRAPTNSSRSQQTRSTITDAPKQAASHQLASHQLASHQLASRHLPAPASTCHRLPSPRQAIARTCHGRVDGGLMLTLAPTSTQRTANADARPNLHPPNGQR